MSRSDNVLALQGSVRRNDTACCVLYHRAISWLKIFGENTCISPVGVVWPMWCSCVASVPFQWELGTACWATQWVQGLLGYILESQPCLISLLGGGQTTLIRERCCPSEGLSATPRKTSSQITVFYFHAKQLVWLIWRWYFSSRVCQVYSARGLVSAEGGKAGVQLPGSPFQLLCLPFEDLT